MGAIGDDDHPRVQAVANADAAAVVDGDPARPVNCVDHGVEDRPVSDCVEPSFIASVSRFGLATEPQSR